MRLQAPVLCGQVVVLLLVHFLIHHILLGDTQRPTGTLLVDFRGTASRLDTRLEAPVAPS